MEDAADQEGLSLNQTVKRLLRKALGLDAPARPDHRADFEDLFGTWSEAEAEAFNERVRECEEIDEEEW